MEYKVVVNENGTCWYKPGTEILHREDGPAVEYVNGNKSWYLNGKLHREDGPALEKINVYKIWYLNGMRHREDGPAAEYSNGNKFWYLNGERLNKEEFLKKTAPVKELTVAEISNLLGYEVKIVK